MNRKLRNAILQAGFVTLLVLILGGFVVTARHNLEAQGITSGFGFLERSTGWDMGFSFMPISISDPYWWALLQGLTNTFVVGYAAMAFATFIGVGLAAMRISQNVVLYRVSGVYIDLIRNIPPILQVLAWYAVFSSFPAPRQALQLGDSVFLSARGLYLPTLNVSGAAMTSVVLLAVVAAAVMIWIGFSSRFRFETAGRKALRSLVVVVVAVMVATLILSMSRLPDTPLWSIPELKGFNFRGGMSAPPELITIFVATMVYGSAYIAEIVRGGFLSVERGKIEAGKALGLSGWLIFSRIQLPITIKNILPMMTNLYVWLIKATTLGVAVGFSDLFAVTVSSINQSGQTIEFILILAAAFWILNSSLVWIMNGINTRLQRRERR